MPDPEFLSWDVILQLHEESIRRWGGTAGTRDRGQIESALGAAEFTWIYGGSLFDVAAAYAFILQKRRLSWTEISAPRLPRRCCFWLAADIPASLMTGDYIRRC